MASREPVRGNAQGFAGNIKRWAGASPPRSREEQTRAPVGDAFNRRAKDAGELGVDYTLSKNAFAAMERCQRGDLADGGWVTAASLADQAAAMWRKAADRSLGDDAATYRKRAEQHERNATIAKGKK